MQSFLDRAILEGTPEGSYLIVGNSEGLVRREADAFLQRVFCDTHVGCGLCPGCQKYLGRSHVDLLVVEGTKVEHAAAVPPFLAKRAFEGGTKAVLIEHVDLMTPQAQNALLKSVEEPPTDTVMVLCAVNEKAVLPTIRSRCIHIEAEPDSEDALQRLMAKTQLPKEQAQILLRISDGDFVHASELHDKDYFAVRRRASEAVSRLLFAKNKATSRIESLLMEDDDDLDFALRAALIYLSDIMYTRFMGESAPVKNVDMRSQLKKDAGARIRRITTVCAGLDALNERLGACRALNKKLALQGALLDILEDIV